jgi:DNA-binding CsgD family transcriptional regulator
MIIRSHTTGRILGVVKNRPEWATEDNLRRIILMPALRYYTAALQFFREGRSAIQIGREMGISQFAVRTFLGRIRKAAGGPRERLTEAKLTVYSKQTMAAIKQAALSLTQHGAIPRSKGRRFADTWANNDRLLRETILGPSLRVYDIARRFWLLNQSAPQIAAALNMTVGMVSHYIALIRRHAQNPQFKPRVMLSKTRGGKSRKTVISLTP